MREISLNRVLLCVSLIASMGPGCGIRTILPESGSEQADTGSTSGQSDASMNDSSRPEQLCGNGVIDVDESRGIFEQCDGEELGGETCSSLGEGEGELRCGPACYFDVSMCVPLQPTGGYGGGGPLPDGAVGDGGFPPVLPPGIDGGGDGAIRVIRPADNGAAMSFEPGGWFDLREAREAR
jgi:hypothetical protein